MLLFSLAMPGLTPGHLALVIPKSSFYGYTRCRSAPPDVAGCQHIRLHTLKPPKVFDLLPMSTLPQHARPCYLYGSQQLCRTKLIVYPSIVQLVDVQAEAYHPHPAHYHKSSSPVQPAPTAKLVSCFCTTAHKLQGPRLIGGHTISRYDQSRVDLHLNCACSMTSQHVQT